jgi:DNA-binding transcriptional LysR family regulator
MLDFELLRAFVAVAECGDVSMAITSCRKSLE